MHPEAHEKFVADSANSSDELNMETASNLEIDNDPIFSYQEQRSIIHRVDRRLVVTCGLLYCFSLIDRGNLGAASIAGLVSPLQPMCITIERISRSDQYSVPRMTDDLMLDVGFRYVRCFQPNLIPAYSPLGKQSTIVLVFYAFYVIFQPLATFLCRQIGPRIFLAMITLLWGLTAMVND